MDGETQVRGCHERLHIIIEQMSGGPYIVFRKCVPQPPQSTDTRLSQCLLPCCLSRLWLHPAFIEDCCRATRETLQTNPKSHTWLTAWA